VGDPKSKTRFRPGRSLDLKVPSEDEANRKVKLKPPARGRHARKAPTRSELSSKGTNLGEKRGGGGKKTGRGMLPTGVLLKISTLSGVGQ